ncbi:peptidylprolyl isomerase [Patescibacteria group bacterium]|nr:peptidylprolyl isomerase [Patescibacteria group bacterium]
MSGDKTSEEISNQEGALNKKETVNQEVQEVVGFDRSKYTLRNDENPIVVLSTTLGDIVLELYTDKTPITSGNFLKLAKEGFYTNTKFHRVIDGFMIQGGDPNSKGDDTSIYGRGGPGYAIEDEFVSGLSNVRGTISMANSGPNTGGSQFFINFGNNTNLDFDKEPLSSKHPVFGNVVGGIDVVDAIIKVETGAGDIPVTPVEILNVAIY